VLWFLATKFAVVYDVTDARWKRARVTALKTSVAGTTSRNVSNISEYAVYGLKYVSLLLWSHVPYSGTLFMSLIKISTYILRLKCKAFALCCSSSEETSQVLWLRSESQRWCDFVCSPLQRSRWTDEERVEAVCRSRIQREVDWQRYFERGHRRQTRHEGKCPGWHI